MKGDLGFNFTPAPKHSCKQHGMVLEIVTFHFPRTNGETERSYCMRCIEEALFDLHIHPMKKVEDNDE